MKRSWFLFLVMIFAVTVTSNANAVLFDRGGGLIYDDVLDVTWLQDANYVDTTGYDDLIYGYDTGGQIRGEDAITWAENLVYYDSVQNVTWSNWRLPHTLPVNGISYVYGYSVDGSTDEGLNISAPNSAFPGSTGSEMAYMYYNNLQNFANQGLSNTGPFINLMENLYFSGTPYEPENNALWVFGFDTGAQQHDYYNDQQDRYAWAVMDGDVGSAPVPEPTTILLSSLGLAGMGAYLRKRKKK